MDAFELVMDQRHLDQRVSVENRPVVDEAFQVTHQGHDDLGLLRWRVDGVSHAILECCARQLSQAGGVALEHGLNFQNVVDREQIAFLHQVKADPQCLPVAQHLLGGGIGEGFRHGVILEQLVVRRDDVLNRGTVLGLLNGEGIDQNALIRNRRRHTLELRELATGSGQFLEDARDLEAPG